jgi:hypothetical protein
MDFLHLGSAQGSAVHIRRVDSRRPPCSIACAWSNTPSRPCGYAKAFDELVTPKRVKERVEKVD